MTGHDFPLPLILTGIFVVGAFVGRFLNVCIEQFPKHDRLRDQLKAVLPPWRRCAHCTSRPSFAAQLPVIGWWLSDRRCESCKRRISMPVPLIEIITGLLFSLLYWCEIPIGSTATIAHGGLTSHEGPQGPEVITTLWSPIVWLHLRYAFHLLMVSGLIVATEIDRKLRIIPDGCTVPIMLLAIPLSFAFGQLYTVPIWFQDASIARTLQSISEARLSPFLSDLLRPVLIPWNPTEFVRSSPHWHGLLVSVLGMIAGAGSVWIVRQVGFLTLKQEAMGFGDVVLMGMVGSVIGWQAVLAVFVVGAPVLALFFAITNWIVRGDNEIPYGPFLSGATILLLLTWPYSWPFAKRFLDMGPLLFLLTIAAVLSLAVMLYMVRVLKQLLGLDHHDGDNDCGWSSADHLSYYNSERPDEQTGQWRRNQWPGSRAGRGLNTQDAWRNGR